MAEKMQNAPEVRMIIVGVSRDCFPAEITRRRLDKLVKACDDKGVEVTPCKTIVENENDVLAALAEAEKARADAAVIFLGNFGPEGPLAIFAERFPGAVMACAAAEESGDSLIEGRGDAFCGMLNASYNFALRDLGVYIPQRPVGLADELVGRIAHFRKVARVLLGVDGVKILTFGPRPHDFYACNAPIGQLYEMGVEVMENSELDLLQLYEAVDENDEAVKSTAADMAKELGEGNTYPDLLGKLARFEIALVRFAEENLGSREYAIFANKCWPAFERAFGFVPCYVNGRMSSRGMPVACEVDIYGALSEYLCYLAGEAPATLLDINNTVPPDMITDEVDLKGAGKQDLFMGFHCGNTPRACMKTASMKFQLIMNRLMEGPGVEPDITRGTLEGQLACGPTTFFRVQGGVDGSLVSYVAEGNILDIDPRSFGGIGVFAIPNFARFYRHVLVGKHFPHHGAVAFAHCGKVLFDAVKLLGADDISAPLGEGTLYPGENPFAAV